MTAPEDESEADGQVTQKRRRIQFADTDTTWGTTGTPAEAPPAGSLAAWLAKNKEMPTPSAGGAGSGTLSAFRDPDKWWLCCEPLPPIPLGEESATISIGRSDECDVVLPHTQVSRIHGWIKILGAQRYMYEDNGSSNGTLLNGQRVASEKLKVGDVLALGPYEIEIHSSESLQSRDKADAATEEGDLTRVLEQPPQAAMTGGLSEVSITEILQSLEFNRKTGTLEIQGRVPGQLVLCEGRPVSAFLGELVDEEAVVGMADLREGRFVFSGQVEAGEVQIHSTLTKLLLQAARQRDEAD